jgi:UDP-N-acetylglucosamine/UDP-N-acetylgalactosamine diphosphorylase
MDDRLALLKLLEPFGQAHLLAFWDELDESQRQRLAQQIRSIDFAQLQRLLGEEDHQQNWAALAGRAKPPPAFRRQGGSNPFSPVEAIRRGRQALATGQVAALLVAGGQGTRLGFDHAKGMYPIGPVSGATLFEILLQKVLAVSRRYQASVPLWLMTSPATHDETVAFLKSNGWFGLAPQDIFVFCQGQMPAVDAATGRLLLADKYSLAMSPDGHGGMLAALASSGGLAEMRRRDIQQVFYFQVDNPLTPVCDPEFLGCHLLTRSEISTMAVPKRDPFDRVGNIVAIDGRLHIIEYSDLPEEAACRRQADGSLELWAGNTAIHVMDVEFLDRCSHDAAALPFHRACKKVAYLDSQGILHQPEVPNAIKFERFIFDLLPAAERAIVVEVDPAEAFAPVKNAPGAASDTPETAQAAMIALHRRWLEAAGATVDPQAIVEISPLLALDAEELASRIPRGLTVTGRRFFG